MLNEFSPTVLNWPFNPVIVETFTIGGVYGERLNFIYQKDFLPDGCNYVGFVETKEEQPQCNYWEHMYDGVWKIKYKQ